MWDNLKSVLHGWHLQYNPYSGSFQMYDNRVIAMADSELVAENIGDAKLLFERRSKAPLLIEMKNVAKTLGDIEGMTKEQVIDRIIAYLKTSHKS